MAPLRRPPGSVEQHQAEALAAITMDINEFLVKVLKVEAVESLPGAKTVTYHDSCHLKKALGLSEEPRTIIKTNPNYKLVEMKEATAAAVAAVPSTSSTTTCRVSSASASVTTWWPRRPCGGRRLPRLHDAAGRRALAQQ